MFKRINWFWQHTGGGLIAPTLFAIMAAQLGSGAVDNVYQWLLWLHLPIVMLHEFEEYVLPGGFKEFFNTRTIFGMTPPQPDAPLNEPYVFVVNIVVAWVWIILGAWLAPTAPWVGFGPIVFQMFINNVQHTLLFQIKNKGYNPGLVTAVLLLMPYCVFVTWYIVHNHLFTPADWLLGIASGVAVFAAFLATTMTLRRRMRSS